jgi:hypothetical protein
MNNSPAFPCRPDTPPEYDGMTLRDYFAAKAMQALLSDTDWRIDMDIEDTAKAAYMTADAMLKARTE